MPNLPSDPDNITDLAAFRAQAAYRIAADDHDASVQSVPTDLSWGDRGTKPLPLHPVTAGPTQFRLRVDLVGTTSPLWRKLVVPAHLTLDVLHDVLQVAFGFTNSHLHRFALTHDPLGREFEGILTPFDVTEGDIGILESEVRVDQLLTAPGDTLLYTYDFGDDWEHLLTLESVEPQADASTAARCVAGARQGPAEDVGGVNGWEEVLALVADGPGHGYPEQWETVRFLGLTGFVDEIDLDSINRGLDRLAGSTAALDWLRAQPVGPKGPSALALLVAGQSPGAQQVLAGYLAAADVSLPIDLGEAEAATAVIRTFLGLVGDGIRFTEAGYLPPRAVRTIMTTMDPGHRWRGPANREVQTYPVLQLRETVTLLGLTRKFKGELRLSARGRKLQDDPVALLKYLAASLPAERTAAGSEIALLLLLIVAAGETENLHHVMEQIDQLSSMIGWSYGGGGQYGNLYALQDAFDTREVLGWAGLGQLLPPVGSDSSGLDTARARMLARAALMTWA
ncbi:plasmid pRiA4b ORF-3 family protein [Cryobacterium sp. TMT1-2-2]|uniref:plasmid pRiA4b ORF-3 family protein n=1 Tax=Cryobacterium sp. TMT1-2-2 TaxID=1259233 RepID=UPI00106B2BED|nr:plasmid pRiA4b ORF-3 family protein [Cryobacterium sp. TMT1-2-2]TFD11037.1 plasmid pRiA4b ORF-3 family protein [Cryobacterium sp. TMT1-2-2]